MGKWLITCFSETSITQGCFLQPISPEKVRLSWGVESKRRHLAVPFSVFSSFASFQVWVQTLQSLLAPPGHFSLCSVLPFLPPLHFCFPKPRAGRAGTHWVQSGATPLSQVYRSAGGKGSAPGAAGSSTPLRQAGWGSWPCQQQDVGLQQVPVLGFHLAICKPSLWVADVTQGILNVRFSHYTVLAPGAFDTFLLSNAVTEFG